MNLKTLTDQHSSQGIELSDTPTELNAPTGVNLMTVADQIRPKKHTYETKHTDWCWT